MEVIFPWALYMFIAIASIGVILSIVANEHYRFRTKSSFNPWRDIFRYNKTEKNIAYAGFLFILLALLFGAWLSHVDKQQSIKEYEQLYGNTSNK